MAKNLEVSGGKLASFSLIAATAMSINLNKHESVKTPIRSAKIAEAIVKKEVNKAATERRPIGHLALEAAMLKHPHTKHKKHKSQNATKHLPAVVYYLDHETPQIVAEWSKVNICEEGGNWHTEGAEYPGGLGINYNNWIIFGGTNFSPTGAGATPRQQIAVAENIMHRSYGIPENQTSPVPDQNGCDGSW